VWQFLKVSVAQYDAVFGTFYLQSTMMFLIMMEGQSIRSVTTETALFARSVAKTGWICGGV
jgi:hypothetical protein